MLTTLLDIELQKLASIEWTLQIRGKLLWIDKIVIISDEQSNPFPKIYTYNDKTATIKLYFFNDKTVILQR